MDVLPKPCATPMKSLSNALSLACMAALVIALAETAPGDAESAIPMVSQCKLEKTQRVAFRVENRPKLALAMALNIHMYDAHAKWLADELTYDSGLDAPILPIAGLLDPSKVASVTCSIDGYVGVLDQRGIVALAAATTLGRKPCGEKDGLTVDGGPDAEVETAVIGKGWILIRLLLSINHFLGDQESKFKGDVFASRLDRGSVQKVVVSGSDPQAVSFLYTGLRPGFHQLEYAPWFGNADSVVPEEDSGYHNFCAVV